MRVRIFRNLTRKCYSIQACVAGDWRTVAHATDATLDGVSFKVSETGRQRVLSSGKKTVHAYVIGDLLGYSGAPRVTKASHEDVYGALYRATRYPAAPPVDARAVSYNPRKGPLFVDRSTGNAVLKACYAYFTPEGVSVRG